MFLKMVFLQCLLAICYSVDVGSNLLVLVLRTALGEFEQQGYGWIYAGFLLNSVGSVFCVMHGRHKDPDVHARLVLNLIGSCLEKV